MHVICRDLIDDTREVRTVKLRVCNKTSVGWLVTANPRARHMAVLRDEDEGLVWCRSGKTAKQALEVAMALHDRSVGTVARDAL